MVKVEYTELLKIIRGKWNGIQGGVFTNFAIDSRKVLHSGLFFALKGNKTDGHLYINDAVRNGATGIITEKEIKGIHVFVLQTESSHKALFSLGKYARGLMNGKVIGITGSSGKTTVKEMVALAIKTKFSVSATKGNANTEYSIPLFFLNDANPESKFFVVEMGIQKRGDMNVLTDIALPNVGVLLNAGKSHLEFLNSVKGVADEKFGLAQFVENSGGISVVNGDDKEFSHLLSGLNRKPVLFGFGANNDVRAHIKLIDVERMTLEILSFGRKAVQTFPYSGVHYAYDILATVAVSEVIGLELKTVLSALTEFSPISGRGNTILLSDGRVIFDETYNANPLSLEYSLSRFKNRKGNLCVIVGDMLELGKSSEKAHKESGKIIASFLPQCVITYGKYARFISDVCRDAGIKNVVHFTEKDSLLEYVSEIEIPEGTLIFVKGSRGMKMEEVLNILIKRYGNNE